MTERWLPIDGWGGAYEVSDHGNVRSVNRTIAQSTGSARFFAGKTLRQSDMNGYRTVGLHFAGKSTRATVHRLVLEAFVGKRPEGMECCHGDGDRANNSLSNLRWDTNAANVADKVKHGTNSRTMRLHCAQGHTLDSANTYVSPGGDRQCRTCRKAIAQRGYAENTERRREYARNYYRDNYAIPAEEQKPSITEVNASKVNCLHGHRLELPNLMPARLRDGHRACLACSRARAYVSRHKHLRECLQEVSDRYYAELTKGDPK